MTRTRNKRKTAVIVLSSVVAVLFAFSVIQQAFNLTPYLGAPERQITLLLWALTSLNVILLTIFSLILLRNLLKLYFERKTQQLGSKFRTKLVFAFLGLSLIPATFMSFFAYFLLHRNLDKWFSYPIDHLLESVNQVVDQVRPDSVLNAQQSARFLATHPAILNLVNARLQRRPEELQRIATEFNLSLVLLLDRYRNATCGFSSKAFYWASQPEFKGLTDRFQLLDWNSSGGRLGDLIYEKIFQNPPDRDSSLIRKDQDGSEIIFAGSIVRSESFDQVGELLIGYKAPGDIVKLADQIAKSRNYYRSWSEERKVIRTNYLLWLGLLTLLVLFAAVWIGLYLSRRITIPIQALAEAANEVSRGNLNLQVNCPAEDELGILVSSFNRMTTQLHESSRRLEKTNRDLQESNLALEERRQYMEAVLENIPTGVVSIAPEMTIRTMNRAAQEMLDIEKPAENLDLDTVFGPGNAAEIRALLAKASRVEVATKDLQLRLKGRKLYVAVTVSSLNTNQESSPGSVMVLEDMTEVLKSQKANAWREVARRMAHEIKNPLTPIQLSAERLLKNYTRTKESVSLLSGIEGPDFEKILQECVQTISTEVATLKSMVDEFSRFARLPSASLVSCNINNIIENVLTAYNGRFQNVTVVKCLSSEVPEIRLDPEQMKRVLVNLFDNALEAMEDCPEKKLMIGSQFYPQKETVEVVVEDTGHGIPAADKDRLFLPYFSTRKRGTGLGLAIVSRIVADHKGYIHVEDKKPRGTRFVIEIPTV